LFHTVAKCPVQQPADRSRRTIHTKKQDGPLCIFVCQL
jgi:hypothetical protein